MMSRTLSTNLLKGELKRKLWLYIITVIVKIIFRPVALLMAIDSYRAWGQTISQANLIDNISYSLTFGASNNLFMLLVLSVAYAFTSFGYLYSKSRIDLYHSIPLDRKSLYRTFFTSAVLPYYLIEIFIFLCNIGVLALKGLLIGYTFKIVLSTFIYNLIVFVNIFALASIAILLTGQILTGVLGVLTFLFASTIMSAVIESYKSFAYQTYTYNYDFNLLKFITSPLTMTSSLERSISDGIGRFVILIVMTILLVTASVLLYIKKPSDSVNKGLAYKILNPIIRIPVVICAALLGGIYVSTQANSLTLGWFWLGFIVLGIIAHCLVNGIIHSDIKKVLDSKLQLLISLVVAAVIALFFIYDIGGYDRYLPAEDKVDYVAIEFSGLHDDINSYKLVEGADGYSLTYDDMNWHRLNAMQSKDVDTVIALAKLGIENLDSRRSAFERREVVQPQPIDDVAVEYAADGPTDIYVNKTSNTLVYDDPVNGFTVKYHLKSGRDVYRRYSVSIKDSFALTAKIYNSEEYKNSFIQIEDFINNNKISAVTGNDNNSQQVFSLKGEQAVELARALEKDYREASLKTMADELPICDIQSGSATDLYENYLFGYYIYPSFKNTLDLLKSYGIDVDTSEYKMDLASIDSILISRYDNTSENMQEVTYEKGKDDEMIKELYDKLIFNNYTYVNSILKEYETNVDICVNYIADKGYMNNFYGRVERGNLPKEVFSALGLQE